MPEWTEADRLGAFPAQSNIVNADREYRQAQGHRPCHLKTNARTLPCERPNEKQDRIPPAHRLINPRLPYVGILCQLTPETLWNDGVGPHDPKVAYELGPCGIVQGVVAEEHIWALHSDWAFV